MKRLITGLVIIIEFVALGMVGYYGIQLAAGLNRNAEAAARYDAMADRFTVEADNTEDTVVVDAAGQVLQLIDEYEEKSPIKVDFENLQKVNPDIIGWIYCPDTVINYPIVQGRDNEQYLHVNSDGAESGIGSIFLDCGNDASFCNYYNVLYGHCINDGSMFGSLSQWNKQEYYEKHPVFYLNTATGRNYRIDVIASFVEDAGGDAFRISFGSSEEYGDHLAWLGSRSVITPCVEYGNRDQTIAFTTCAYSYETARQIVVGIMSEIG